MEWNHIDVQFIAILGDKQIDSVSISYAMLLYDLLIP